MDQRIVIIPITVRDLTTGDVIKQHDDLFVRIKDNDYATEVSDVELNLLDPSGDNDNKLGALLQKYPMLDNNDVFLDMETGIKVDSKDPLDLSLECSNGDVNFSLRIDKTSVEQSIDPGQNLAAWCTFVKKVLLYGSYDQNSTYYLHGELIMSKEKFDEENNFCPDENDFNDKEHLDIIISKRIFVDNEDSILKKMVSFSAPQNMDLEVNLFDYTKSIFRQYQSLQGLSINQLLLWNRLMMEQLKKQETELEKVKADSKKVNSDLTIKLLTLVNSKKAKIRELLGDDKTILERQLAELSPKRDLLQQEDVDMDDIESKAAEKKRLEEESSKPRKTAKRQPKKSVRGKLKKPEKGQPKDDEKTRNEEEDSREVKQEESEREIPSDTTTPSESPTDENDTEFSE